MEQRDLENQEANAAVISQGRTALTLRERLEAARKLVERPECWGQGYRGLDRPMDTFCVAEALERATPDWFPRREVVGAIKDQIGTSIIVGWNDAPGRTHADVLAAFDRAIELAGAQSGTALSVAPQSSHRGSPQ